MSKGSEKYAKKLSALATLLASAQLSTEKVVGGYPHPDEYTALVEGSDFDGQEEWLEERMPSGSHHRDSRSNAEYAADLIMGWVMEDVVKLMLEDAGWTVGFIGADVGRELLKTGIKATPDFAVRRGERAHIVEFVQDYGGYWKNQNRCELRDDKFLRLLAEAETASSARRKATAVVLGLDISACEFFSMIVTEKEDAEYLPHHFLYHKPAYRLNLKGISFYPPVELGTRFP